MSLERKCLVWTVLAALVLADASTGQACECLWPWNWFRKPTVAYAPATYAAPAAACGSCSPVTTYMPVTAYRTVYQPTPVTTYQPTTSGCGLFKCFNLFNCCGRGTAATTYRPVTSIAYQAALVPYTTYRPVTTVSASVCAPACDPCSTTTTYSLGSAYTPTYTPALSTVPAASGCAAGDCGAPAIQSYPAATGTTMAPGTVVTPGTTVVPSQPAQTFKDNGQQNYRLEQNGGNSSPVLKPQAETSTDLRFQQPELIRPNTSTTSYGAVRQATFYRPVVMPTGSDAAKPQLDTGGWHAARN